MEIDNGVITKVSADREDPLSGGFICAKGAAIPELEADPDRLRTPLVRKDGRLQPASWDQAFAFVDARLSEIIAKHGRQAVSVYVGNAAAHNLSMLTYFADFVTALGTTNIFTAGSVDQIPRQAVSGLLYGDEFSVSVPDVDRAQLLWIIGANPAESNGSLMVAPGFLGRMQKLQGRGGRIVVIDPRNTMTAKRADEHIAIRPSGDAAFLAAVAHMLLKIGPAPSAALSLCDDLSSLESLLAPFSPRNVTEACLVEAKTIERLAAELRDTPAAALYGRMGTTTQEFSSLVCWLIDLVNILAGNLDVEGGAMFAKPLLAQANSIGVSGVGSGFALGRWTTRVSGAPESTGQLPMACLAEEIETPGDGQIRAMITLAGNPMISSPESARLDAALDKLELLVGIDIYVNETTSKADVIFPSPPRLAKPNYDSFLYRFAVRNYGRYTHPFRSLAQDERSDREILLRLTAIAQGAGWKADIEAIDEGLLRAVIRGETSRPASLIEGRDPDEIFEAVEGLQPLQRRMDLGLRTGPHGDGFGVRNGIGFAALSDTAQGLDCGPLVPRLPEMLRTTSGRIELMHPIFVSELARLGTWLSKPRPRYVLIGRRQLRSNNSWFHNLPRLSHPTRECDVQMNCIDAAELGVQSGDMVAVATSKGVIEAPVDVTEDIVSGVVSMPHGWGHAKLTNTLTVASANPGVNVNDIIDFRDVDPLTWTARVNGVPVDIRKLPARALS